MKDEAEQAVGFALRAEEFVEAVFGFSVHASTLAQWRDFAIGYTA
jgi:hypothetical protein